MGEFAAGLALGGVKGQYGYIGKDGNFVLQPQYDRATGFFSFERGKGKTLWAAAVRKSEKWGLINTNGSPISKFTYNTPSEALDSLR